MCIVNIKKKCVERNSMSLFGLRKDVRERDRATASVGEETVVVCCCCFEISMMMMNEGEGYTKRATRQRRGNTSSK